jgi:hypothetical protein
VAKRGRPQGSKDLRLNQANVAAGHASLLLELWLADAPVIEVRALLWPFSWSTEHQALIEKCWSRRKHERRFTVPPKIKRALCQLAVAYVMELQQQKQDVKLEIEASLRRSKAAAEAELKARGWSDEEIAAHFNKLEAAARKRRKDFKTPDVKKVLEIVNRRTPRQTLRRPNADRRNLRN